MEVHLDKNTIVNIIYWMGLCCKENIYQDSVGISCIII